MQNFIITVAINFLTLGASIFSYWNPLKKSKGYVLRARKIYFVIILSLMVFNSYLAWSSKNTDEKNTEEKINTENKNQRLQLALKISVDNGFETVAIYNKKIDSIGYKIDALTGKLVPKKQNEKILMTTKELQGLYVKVHNLSKRFGDNVIVEMESYCNAPFVATQIADMLTSKKFKVLAVTGSPGGPIVKKVVIDAKTTGVINIIVGYFD